MGIEIHDQTTLAKDAESGPQTECAGCLAYPPLLVGHW